MPKLSLKAIEKSSYFQKQPSRDILKGILKIYSKVTGEHPCQMVILILLLSNFILKLRECSPVNLLLILRTPLPRNTFGGFLQNFFRNCQYEMVNLFHPTKLFLYTLKKSENQRFSDVFRSYRRRPWYGVS